MSFPLRLFDQLIELDHPEFTQPRAQLWRWISEFQIPCILGSDEKKGYGNLWTQFFEDYAVPTNRNAWSPLNLARYLIERKETLDPAWREHAHALIEFVNKTFTSVRFGVTVCGEQDTDHKPWGGVNSTYASVLALYSAATGSSEYKLLAHQALTFVLYAVNEDGHPLDTVGPSSDQAWQEDAHTDVVHNVVDALVAFPEWK
jgi:hypothetical protein